MIIVTETPMECIDVKCSTREQKKTLVIWFQNRTGCGAPLLVGKHDDKEKIFIPFIGLVPFKDRVIVTDHLGSKRSATFHFKEWEELIIL